jgi:hypothetical protein
MLAMMKTSSSIFSKCREVSNVLIDFNLHVTESVSLPYKDVCTVHMAVFRRDAITLFDEQ